MRALVTGAAGFIGSHLTDQLLGAGHEVVAVDRFSDYYPRWLKERNTASFRHAEGCRFVEGDLATLQIGPLLAGIDCVFHLAAQAGVRASWGSAFDAYLRDNVLATQRLLEAAKGTNVRKVVYTSSSSVYGDAERYPTVETDTPLPISPYGVTKLSAEHLCRLYSRRFDVPAVSLRFFTVYGPRQRPDMAFHIFGKALLTGRPIDVYGDGEQSREFTYVDDVVRAVLLAGERGEPGAVYNIGGGSEVTLNAVLEQMMSIAGREVPLRYGETMPGDVKRTAADPTLAREKLGYQASIPLAQGLQAELAWLEELVRLEEGGAADGGSVPAWAPVG